MIPVHELIEGGGPVAGGDLGERLAILICGIAAVQIADLDHAGDDGPMVTAIV